MTLIIVENLLYALWENAFFVIATYVPTISDLTIIAALNGRLVELVISPLSVPDFRNEIG